MKKHKFRIYSVFIFIFFLLCGCSSQPTMKGKSITISQPSNQMLNKATKHDGKLISMVKINVKQKYNDLQSYRMTYWSAGVKVVAYVVLPTIKGPYPMLVHTHGGYTLPEPNYVHIVNFVYQGTTVSLNTSFIKNSSDGIITLVPMYRGYGESGGHVQGLVGDTLDSNNAITALQSYLNAHKSGPQLEKNHIYLIGESFGGGVALKLATERKDIVYVIAISPFTGWDIQGAWFKQHDQSIFNALEKAYGPFNPNRSAYKKRSIDYKKIKAPTLLIQGTADPYVPWQTVQEFYNKMKSNHQNVTFKLIKGGNHNLMNNESELNIVVGNFTADYGRG